MDVVSIGHDLWQTFVDHNKEKKMKNEGEGGGGGAHFD
jgi:hypothetical protein